jgi:hypothetical protein
MTATTPDLDALTDEELRDLITRAQALLDERTALERIPTEFALLNRTFLTASGQEQGEPWRQPTGGHDAYPVGWQVTHGGKTWTSTAPSNVWEPGVSGWREVTEGEVPEWIRPTGAHDAYQAGDEVTWNGAVWVSISNANVWEPGTYGWEKYTEPEPEPGEGETPAEWVQPSGGHDAYNIGDRVTFEGAVYESVIAGNTFSPAAYPQGWSEIA